MLNIEIAEQTLTWLTSKVLGQPVEIRIAESQGKLQACSPDITGLLGLPMFAELKICSSNIKPDAKTGIVWVSMVYSYAHKGGGFNSCECYSAHLNPDGTLHHYNVPDDRTQDAGYFRIGLTDTNELTD